MWHLLSLRRFTCNSERRSGSSTASLAVYRRTISTPPNAYRTTTEGSTSVRKEKTLTRHESGSCRQRIAKKKVTRKLVLRCGLPSWGLRMHRYPMEIPAIFRSANNVRATTHVRGGFVRHRALVGCAQCYYSSKVSISLFKYTGATHATKQKHEATELRATVLSLQQQIKW